MQGDSGEDEKRALCLGSSLLHEWGSCMCSSPQFRELEGKASWANERASFSDQVHPSPLCPNPLLSPPPVIGCSESTLSKTYTPTVCSPHRLQVGLTAGWQAPELFNVCALFYQSPQVHLTSASSVQDTYDSGRHRVFAGHSERRQRKMRWFPGGLRQPKAWLVPVFKRSLSSRCDFPIFRLPLLLRYWTQHSPHWQHWTACWLPVAPPQCSCLCGEGLTSEGNIHT